MLPVLESFQHSAERGVLYKNAVLAPHYNLNAYSIMYITSSSSRLQILKNDGSQVFDDWVQEGQLIVVPQGFVVIKKAGEEGCEWVAFKTNDNMMTMQLTGRFSYIRALPEEVLMNSYNISREDAKILKYSRKEGVVLSLWSGSISPIKKARECCLSSQLKNK
ncbi:putative 11-S seed storage protein, plant [Helianthus annuus]|nr:putative 11-S seed storage protein, plant [Helianthus annuus]